MCVCIYVYIYIYIYIYICIFEFICCLPRPFLAPGCSASQPRLRFRPPGLALELSSGALRTMRRVPAHRPRLTQLRPHLEVRGALDSGGDYRLWVALLPRARAPPRPRCRRLLAGAPVTPRPEGESAPPPSPPRRAQSSGGARRSEHI